jgi:hypothetical protein
MIQIRAVKLICSIYRQILLTKQIQKHWVPKEEENNYILSFWSRLTPACKYVSEYHYPQVDCQYFCILETYKRII